MCGIYGWQLKEGALSKEQRTIIATMLGVANDSRGGDSWGVYNFESIVKGVGDIGDHILETVDFDQIICHTRKATTGKISVENAHPFEFGDIIGAHNGIIYNHDDLNKSLNRNFEVDSMHLIKNLAEGKDFKDISGYGAVQWTNKQNPSRIYLCRVSQSADLGIAGIVGKDKDDILGIVWSSNDSHLKKALKVAGVEFILYNVPNENIFIVDDGNLYKSDDKLEFKTYTVSKSYGSEWQGYDYRNWRNHSSNDDDKKKASKTSLITTDTTEKTPKTNLLKDSVQEHDKLKELWLRELHNTNKQLSLNEDDWPTEKDITDFTGNGG